MKPSRCCAIVLLAAALAMVIETSCSEAPPPAWKTAPATSRERLEAIAKVHGVARLHLVDGTIVPTSQYSLTDSSVVVSNVLRGSDYFPTDPKLYKTEEIKQLPRDVRLPHDVSMKQIAWVEEWKNPHGTRKGVVGAVLIFGGLVAAFAILIANMEIDIN